MPQPPSPIIVMVSATRFEPLARGAAIRRRMRQDYRLDGRGFKVGGGVETDVLTAEGTRSTKKDKTFVIHRLHRLRRLRQTQ